jgi:hypothetical protein
MTAILFVIVLMSTNTWQKVIEKSDFSKELNRHQTFAKMLNILSVWFGVLGGQFSES